MFPQVFLQKFTQRFYQEFPQWFEKMIFDDRIKDWDSFNSSKDCFINFCSNSFRNPLKNNSWVFQDPYRSSSTDSLGDFARDPFENSSKCFTWSFYSTSRLNFCSLVHNLVKNNHYIGICSLTTHKHSYFHPSQISWFLIFLFFAIIDTAFQALIAETSNDDQKLHYD